MQEVEGVCASHKLGTSLYKQMGKPTIKATKKQIKRAYIPKGKKRNPHKEAGI